MPQPQGQTRQASPAATGWAALRERFGAGFITDPALLALYATDATPAHCVPAGVVFPHRHEDVVDLVHLANRFRIPLVARGAGSGNVGGALPVPGAVVVSFECMKRILEFDPQNRLLVVEAGTITRDIDALARTQGLFYPPDPGSMDYCRIGGNIAMNAAGPRAVKYGVTGDYVLGLRAVAGNGSELRTGCRTTKGVVGYDLTHLLVGSEGTLALVTEATLKLLPAPPAIATLRAAFSNPSAACAAVTRVMNQPVVPCALEFLDDTALRLVRDAGAAGDVPAHVRSLLILEVDGDAEQIASQVKQVRAALEGEGCIEIAEGHAPMEVAALWAARRSLSHAVKRLAPLKINEDVVVPVGQLRRLLERLDALSRQYRLLLVSFGHAGNGNLHVNLMVDPDNADEMRRAQACLHELFTTVLALGGTLSGEHGIGTTKRDFVPLEVPGETLAMMRAVKRSFDPNHILNPGKLLPDT